MISEKTLAKKLKIAFTDENIQKLFKEYAQDRALGGYTHTSFEDYIGHLLYKYNIIN